MALHNTGEARLFARLRDRLKISAAACALMLLCNQSAAAQKTNFVWSPWFELGSTYSSERSRGEIMLFAPLRQNGDSLFFADVRGKLFEEAVSEGNFALGYRHMLNSGWNLGVWGGYDLRRTETGTLFGQVAGGVEALSHNWDFRTNLYIPTDSDKTISAASFAGSSSTVSVVAGNLLMNTIGTTTTTTTRELALWGFDGEIGARVPFEKWMGTSGKLGGELRLYAGAFHFDHADLSQAVAGPKLRAEWRIDDVMTGVPGSRLTFDAGWRHDEVRGSAWEAGIRLRLPFGAGGSRLASLSSQQRRMVDRLERDTDIVAQDSTSAATTTNSSVSEQVEDTQTSVRIDRVATVDATGNVQNTVTNAGANSLIILDGTAGTFNQGATSVNLTASQTVLGSGATLRVRGLTTGNVANFTAAGATPTYNFTGTNNAEAAMMLASNNHVSGVNMVGDPVQQTVKSFMFSGSGVTNTALTNLDLHNFYGGFVLNNTGWGTGVSNVSMTMDRVTAHNDDRGNSSASVDIEGDNNTFTLTNSSFTNIRPGLNFRGDGTTVVADNITVERTNINVGGLGVFNATGGGTSSLTIRNSYFNDISGLGIWAGDGTGVVNFELSNTTVAGVLGTSGIGVRIDSANSTASVNGLTFTGRLSHGVVINGANNTLSGTGNTSTAIFSSQLCLNAGGAQNGTITFTSPAMTCP